ncbi:hypothetical protein, partial [Brevundimonas sp.]|uniref:hypothetical protein n=1 Tax=Brevundimonas sp. TaxID=1871086 RepID=UPI00391DD000
AQISNCCRAMDGSDQESVRAAVLQLIMDHLEWEGMLLEREAVAEAYRLRFGDPDADTTAWLRTDADGSAGDGSRLLKLVQAAVHAEPRGRGASAGRPAAVAAAVAAAVPSMSAAITPASAALHSSAADELFFDEVDTPAGRVTQVRRTVRACPCSRSHCVRTCQCR